MLIRDVLVECCVGECMTVRETILCCFALFHHHHAIQLDCPRIIAPNCYTFLCVATTVVFIPHFVCSSPTLASFAA